MDAEVSWFEKLRLNGTPIGQSAAPEQVAPASQRKMYVGALAPNENHAGGKGSNGYKRGLLEILLQQYE